MVGVRPERKDGRPRIGVTGSRHRGRFMWWLNRFAIWRAGGRAVRVVPGAERRLDGLDGLLVGGGDDIHPELYGSDIVLTVRVDQRRDELERAAISDALSRDLPVLGICRGAQMINVVRGGTLHTDIHEAYEDVPRMRTILPRKIVRLEPGSRLFAITGCDACRVNALHHQSVDRVGDGLAVVGRDDHGIVQAIEARGHEFLLGVQWHPEFLPFHRGQQALFGALVDAAAGRAVSAGARDTGLSGSPAT